MFVTCKLYNESSVTIFTGTLGVDEGVQLIIVSANELKTNPAPPKRYFFIECGLVEL